MAILTVENLSHSFGEKMLYKNVNFEIYKNERIGIIGKNGAGKTTLLRSLINEITPDTGQIRWQKNIKIGYLDQHAEINQNFTIFEYLKSAFDDLYKIEDELNYLYSNMSNDFNDYDSEKISNYQNLLINRDFYEIESTIFKVANGLGVNSFGMQNKLKNLSGGQRAKVILSKLLLENPDVLLLDEPTNFLDVEHVKWLAEYLENFKGVFIIISHDFDFIDRTTNCILNIEFQQITKYNGNFAKFLEIKNLRRESYVREFRAQQKEIKKLKDYIDKNKVRASTAKQAQSRMKKLEKMDVLVPTKELHKPNFRLVSIPIFSKKALKVKNLEIGYEKSLLPKITFEVNPGEKIIITGFNGIGKSTFLKTLVGKISPISGSYSFDDYVKLAYFEQDLVWDNPNKTPIEIVLEKFSNWSIQEARNNLAQFGIFSKIANQKICTLSGGEQSKVKLCILGKTKSNFLILDEPSNHLDDDSKAVLKRELFNWKGNLILVSHEINFWNGLADRIIKFQKF